MSAARICYNCRGPLEPSRKLLCLKCESTMPYEEAKNMSEAESVEITKQGFEFLCRQSAIIAMLPLEDWRQAFDRADTIAPILDPTLYKMSINSKKTEAIRQIIDAAIPLKRVVEKWQAVLGASDQ